jgi:hypothetical protein
VGGQKVHKAQEGRQSRTKWVRPARQRQAHLFGIKTLRSAKGSRSLAADEPRKLVRGDQVKAWSCRSRGKTLEGEKAHESEALVFGLNSLREVAAFGVEQGPEGEGRI